MEIKVFRRDTNVLNYTFDTENPFAIFIGYQRIDHELYICREPDGQEYKPYICSNCQEHYGGHISRECPKCGNPD